MVTITADHLFNFRSMLDEPPTEARDAQLVKEIRFRTQAAFEAAGSKTPLQHYCAHNGVPLPLAKRMVRELNDFEYNHTFMPVDAVVDKPMFSRAEAIQLVTEAFEEFNPRMATCIRDAAKEGRISFAPSGFRGPHQGWVNINDTRPDDINKLGKNFDGQPYASVPLKQEKLSLSDLFSLAHECGHLASATLYQQAKGKNAFNYAQPLAESFSLMGEHILQHNLLRKYEADAQMCKNITAAYNRVLQNNLFNCANAARFEADIHDAYAPFHKAGTGETTQAEDALQEAARRAINAGEASKLLMHEPLSSLSYPIATIAAHKGFRRWKLGAPGEATRWNEVAEKGAKFDESMEHLGTTISSPHFISGGIRHYEEQERQLEAHASKAQEVRLRTAIDKFRAERPHLAFSNHAVSTHAGVSAQLNIERAKAKGTGKQ